MRTLSLEPSNPIVRFINQMRFYRMHDYKDFPSDICALTRVFIYNLVFCSFFAFFGSLLLVSLVFFWMSFPMAHVEPPGIGLLFMIVGAIGSLTIGALAIIGFFVWLAEDTPFWDMVGDYVDKGINRLDDVLESRSEDSALLAMWESFKNKTCFRVEVKDK